jgi:hypothetical protein
MDNDNNGSFFATAKDTHSPYDDSTSTKNMGNAMRMIRYDHASNERQAISALTFAAAAATSNAGDPNLLSWFRLDDGVMGGSSETQHYVDPDTHILHFNGTIDTNGGGFTSIRTKITTTPASQNTEWDAVRIRYKGDGKTYKFFFTDGSRMGPMARKPSWQADIPTIHGHPDWQEKTIPFDQLLPSFVGRSNVDKSKYTFQLSEMKEMGFMLSLILSDGRPNPVETFGQGKFPFSLQIQSIQPIIVKNRNDNHNNDDNPTNVAIRTGNEL